MPCRPFCVPFSIAAALVLLACSGAATPETAANPQRPVRTLTKGDADLLAVSLAAAADVKKQSGGQDVAFAGVFIESEEIKAVTESVIRTYGFVHAERPGMGTQKIVVCGAGTACPQSMRQPVRIAFDNFRIVGDSAYVGGIQQLPVPLGSRAEAMCITLAMRRAEWTAVGRRTLGRAADCGK